MSSSELGCVPGSFSYANILLVWQVSVEKRGGMPMREDGCSGRPNAPPAVDWLSIMRHN